MSAAVDGSNSVIDPEAEVRKLQELVKKLERQNQVLRSKQNNQVLNRGNNTPKQEQPLAQAVNNPHVPSKTEICITDNTKINPVVSNVGANKTERSPKDLLNATLEDVQLLDIESGLVEEDEGSCFSLSDGYLDVLTEHSAGQAARLYTSPKKASPDKSMSPYEWVREEFDHPSPEVESARRMLFYKLEEVIKVPSRSSSSGALSSSPANMSSPSSNHVNTREMNGTPAMPSIRKPLGRSLGSGSQLNTRTFTRPKKSRKPLPEVVNTTSSEEGSTGDTEDSVDYKVPTATEPVISRVEPPVPAEPAASDGHSKYNGITDVKTLARMQEESLRQSLNSPLTTGKKSSLRPPRTTSVPSFGAQHHENSPPSQGSPRSSPARYDSDGYQGMRRSSNSLASASSHSSNASSPPDSPYGSQYLEARHEASHRRSMPNLCKTSNLSVARPQAAEDSPPMRRSGLARPRVQAAQRVASPGRTLSPQRSGIPSPRAGSGIPRPGSKLPTPRKSGIPARSPLTRRQDDSWKDGCY